VCGKQHVVCVCVSVVATDEWTVGAYSTEVTAASQTTDNCYSLPASDVSGQTSAVVLSFYQHSTVSVCVSVLYVLLITINEQFLCEPRKSLALAVQNIYFCQLFQLFSFHLSQMWWLRLVITLLVASTQPSILPWYVHRVPAWFIRHLPMLGGRKHHVISYGRWCSIALRWGFP